MTRSARTESEEKSLKNAQPVLEGIYGDFDWIDEITDRPDAALKTKGGKIVGVEIVQIDNEKYLKRSKTWLKTNKPTDEIKEQHTRLHIIPNEIAKRICLNKNPKLEDYKKTLKFDEFILLMCTENLSLRDNASSGYNKEHFLYALEASLVRNRLKYEKSIITHIFSGDAEIVTSGGVKTRLHPNNFRASDWKNGCHYIDCTIMQFTVNSAKDIVINFKLDKVLDA